MKFAMMIVFGAFCHMMARGRLPSAEVQGDTLVRWQKDFKGVAEIPSGVRHIGEGAFAQCKSVTGVVFPGTVETIGQMAFAGCDHLRNLKIPSGVRHIGYEAFDQCKSLTEVVFSEGVETMGWMAFSGCDHLRGVQVPSSVTNIGEGAFADCLSLTGIVVRARVEKIPVNMCSGCYKLKHVELPNGVSEIGDRAFCGDRSIVDMSLPESVKRIGRSAFAGCCRIRGMVLPKHLQCIDAFAFLGCYDMKFLVMHSELGRIGAGAFQDCYALRRFIVVGSPPVLHGESLVEGGGACTVFVAGGRSKEPFRNLLEGRIRDYAVEHSNSIEDAVAACDVPGKDGPENEMFSGLGRVIRIAEDGLVSGLPENNARVGSLDTFAARLPELVQMEKKDAVKRFFMDHAQFSIDMGDSLTMHFDILNDVGFEVEFNGDRLAKLTMSEGLKNAVRRGLEVEAGSIGIEELNDVRRWLK